MRKSILVIAAVMLMACPVFAEGWGLGYMTDTAPIGLFYDMSETMTLNANVGYNSWDTETVGELETETAIDARLLFELVSGDRSGLHVAPGFTWTNGSYVETDDGQTNFDIQLWLMANWDATDNVTLWFGHGLNIMNDSPVVGESTTNYGTVGANSSNLGFTFWWN
ncbi:MAG: hypothetical protein QF819_06310 [Gemmatimonadota bacterium]|jgi:hypothetical protein|nr:hypothetical protein [Gemmatimonadota bacterium]MDP6460651.1 hypothetical protein [Gemmatimonadota bacterium]MDP6529827.1 hypothetical protein [Gemmatimonadota bacterium]MDP6802770.1 hypothetical protein [Gemmatimonadota bacterium]MDP7032106.1 hypothetical protein [Gemmatimonadota bacterium]